MFRAIKSRIEMANNPFLVVKFWLCVHIFLPHPSTCDCCSGADLYSTVGSLHYYSANTSCDVKTKKVSNNEVLDTVESSV